METFFLLTFFSIHASENPQRQAGIVLIATDFIGEMDETVASGEPTHHQYEGEIEALPGKIRRGRILYLHL